MNQEDVNCPFNAAHRVPKHRLAKHIITCSLQNNMTKYLICPFNRTHVVQKKDFDDHVEGCIDKNALERDYLPLPVAGDLREPLTCSVDPEDGDWENDNYESFLVHKDVERAKKPLINLGETNQSKAARRAFRREERTRFQQLNNK